MTLGTMYAIAKKLYPFTDPVGKDIRVDGRKYQVIGVFDEKKSAFGGAFDNPLARFRHLAQR